MKTLEWIEAYTYKYEKGIWNIYFEDTIVLRSSSGEMMATITGALNGAYNLGRSNMKMEIEFKK